MVNSHNLTQGFSNKPLTRVNFLSRKELAELPDLLFAGEKVLGVISGIYTAGTAILCVTNLRILLVDKKIIRLSIEDIRFESIREVNYSHQAIMASLRFYYAGRSMQFRTWYRQELRGISQIVQEKMFNVKKQREQLGNQQETVSSAKDLIEDSSLPVASMAELADSGIGASGSGEDLKNENFMNAHAERWRQSTRFVEVLRVASRLGRDAVDQQTVVDISGRSRLGAEFN